MQRWLGDHEQLRELLQRLGDEQAKVQHTQQRIARAARRLRSVLASVGSTKAVAVAAQKSVEQWRQDWTRTTESFVRSGQSTTRQVLQMLDQIHDLCDLENQLAILAAEQPLEDFLDAAGKQQPALLEVEIERRENELQVQREKLASVQQEIGALQHELNLMDGSSRASDLVQSIQLTVGEISHDAEEFARVKIASMILRRAIDHYRNENQSPVLEHANGFFRGLTCGEYQELKPDYDAKGKMTLFGIQPDGKSVPVGAMSAGTSDSLYLALRLASLQHQMAAGQAIPLVIDDCLIQLDDRRAAAALTAFSDLSEKTQIILFTHHDHLLKLAQRNLAPDGFHVHQL